MLNSNEVLQSIQNNSKVIELCSAFAKAKGDVDMHREGWGGLGPLLVAMHNVLQRPFLYIGLNEDKVRTVFADASLFAQGVRFFPEREHPLGVDPVASAERMALLEELLNKKASILFTTRSALFSPTKAPDTLAKSSLVIDSKSHLSFNQLLDILEAWGLNRTDTVRERNEFAVRGGIIDFFPLSSPQAIRIEWYGDEIDSIRTFDVGTQRSIEKMSQIVLYPPESENEAEALLIDYLSPDTLIIREDSESWEEEVPQRLIEWLSQKPNLNLSSLPAKASFSWPFVSINHYEHRFREFLEEARIQLTHGQNIYIYTRQASRLKELFTENDLLKIHVVPSPLSEGFGLKEERLQVYTDQELFGHVFSAPPSHRFGSSRPVSFEELNEGEIVVHRRHGIATYQGLIPVSVEGKTQDYLLLSFQGNDKLYVPLEEMDQVERYIGPEGNPPALSRLGGREWRNTKKRVQEAAGQIAQDLVKLYAARSQLPGHGYSPDTTWQREMEEAFPFQETPDQHRAIAETKSDMESTKPMDRLILGDVGYGKTEVALRAAFKAVMDGKQVALLAPTTILAQQHYETFSERLATFPVRIRLLSRFQTKKEIKEALIGLASGEVDLIIGTHRLLQKDVFFKDLGLLIIDEEQRFGVSHKERLKILREAVDVITLSATPLPRTLYLSLVGARDISLIETPPQERLPVKTFVSNITPERVIQAITQELHRGGQIYYLYNRVETIAKKAVEIEKLVPGIRLAIAHGQMKPSQLEEVMWKFMKGLYDLLLCTTIIQNGLDIPRVNTLIVEEAHRHGLAELYQLRGRVGRADRQAYAYFFVPPDRSITDNAQKRLDTLQEFSHLGGGYQIALKDLEIRGAGNLLGMAQSGFVSEVGFRFYCDILAEEIQKLQGKRPHPKRPQVEINLPIAGFIPDTYVPSRSQKLDFYRRLAALSSKEEVDAILDELVDRFGDPPAEVVRLLEMVKLRLLCIQHNVQEIKTKEDECEIIFWDGQPKMTFPVTSNLELISNRITNRIKKL